MLSSVHALAQSDNVDVTLTSHKRVFKVGEAIVLIVELRNAGTRPLYVSQHIAFLDSSAAGIKVNFFDSTGQVPPHPFAEGFAGPEERRNPSRLVLIPGAFYGIEREALHIPTKPGRYKVVATYFDFTDQYLSEEEKKQLNLLPYPVFTGEHASNPIDVIITK
jgi:hypothetical protein